MQENYCLVLCTCPDAEVAASLGEKIISERLAACVNIVPGVTSIYPWAAKVETATECLLLIKSRCDVYSDLEQFVIKHHPYELPEVIAVTLQHGSSSYLDWINQCLDSK